MSMKRAQRFVCSTDHPPSISKAATRGRKRSRTPSARGGGVNAEPDENPPKRSSTRLQSGSPKNPRKAAGSPKISMSNLGSLQNAVVLAPFHTLKSSFQTKLVDLYSNEKMKKTDSKNKTSRQPNSFQYDVIELKSLGSTIKKEARSPKKTKDKSRSTSYCQCKRNNVRKKDGEGAGRKKGVRVRKMGGDEAICRFTGRREAGTVRASPSVCVPRNSRADIPHRVDFYMANEQPLLFPGTAPRSSARSISRHRNRSGEAANNESPSKEGRMEGSFAISSTSFASYLKQFVQEGPEVVRSRRDNNRKNSKKTKEKFLPKPSADTSRHLILRLEKKNSDEHIVHFMDREPQVRATPSTGSNHHLQPLRRQDRDKEKKGESDRIATYYLRSFSSSRDNDSSGKRRSGRRRRGSGRGNKISLTEVATQVGGNAPEGNTSAGKARSRSRQRASTSEARREKVYRDRPAAEPLAEADCPTSPAEPVGVSELSDALCQSLIGPDENPQDESVQREPLGSEPKDLQEGLGFRLQEFAQPEELQDKESDFIFGPSNAANRLGGSCEFSFGLNSVFPEDED